MDEIKVSVINTSKDITDILENILSGEGFSVCSKFTFEFKDNDKSFDDYIAKNKPDVIVYDIALPYRQNYLLFESLSNRKSVKNIPFVLTTTNKDALEEMVGKTSAHELIGKPYDLQEIIDAVRKAFAKKLVKKEPELTTI